MISPNSPLFPPVEKKPEPHKKKYRPARDMSKPPRMTIGRLKREIRGVELWTNR